MKGYPLSVDDFMATVGRNHNRKYGMIKAKYLSVLGTLLNVDSIVHFVLFPLYKIS